MKPAMQNRQTVERTYVSKDVLWTVVSERRGGFVVPRVCIQYDLSGLPCVLALRHDDERGSIHDAVKAGRAYLHPIRVTLLRAFEQDLVVVRSADLDHGMLIFEPAAMPSPSLESM